MSTAVQTQSRSWKAMVSDLLPTLRPILEAHASELAINSRDLEKQLLLHLPRFTPDELWDVRQLHEESLRLGIKLCGIQAEFSAWANRPNIPLLEKNEIQARRCAPELAQEIYRRFHYIGSEREAVAHIGLFHSSFPDVPFAIAALSTMDIRELRHTIDQTGTTLVLSRVFAFSWAPKNSISFLLGSVNRWIRRNRPDICQLITYLNPNLGFTGSSYCAANWSPFLESPAQYLYFDENYISFRAFEALEERDQLRVQRSRYILEKLRVFKYLVKAE